MKLKEGVRARGIAPETIVGLIVADAVIPNAICTSITEGTHKRSSAHYTGRAFDLRLPPVGAELLAKLVHDLRLALGEPLEPAGVEWDVVLEKDHIHIEFDPKTSAQNSERWESEGGAPAVA